MKKVFIVFLLLLIMSGVVQAVSFQDIEGLDCETAVKNLAYLSIVNGVSEKEYAPAKSVTRAELSKMTTGILKLTNDHSKSFSDIQSHWGKDYIECAASNGVLKGYPDGTFGPNREVTYAETIAILLRGLGFDALENSDGIWYQNYLTKMKEENLLKGVNSFEPQNPANRGDVAILLWNVLQWKGNGTSLLEKNFGEYQRIENEKIIAITNKDNHIQYQTVGHVFFVEEGIDFSHLGGMASGWLNTKTNTLVGLMVDEGKNYQRIAGNSKTISELGYDTFNSNLLMGYGDKDYAEYMEIFVHPDTHKVARAVFYDTRESHFAEKLKIGSTKISIESKDVYDESIIIHKGQTIRLKILRTETVKDIARSALLVHDGKVVEWESVPNNATIREIKKDAIYTYVYRKEDVKVVSDDISLRSIKIGKTEFLFSEDCICENTETDTATRLVEGLTTSDLKLIAKKDNKFTIFLNEFDEITKIQFTYDIWSQKEYIDYQKVTEKARREMNKIGVVSDMEWKRTSENKTSVSAYVKTQPSGARRGCSNVSSSMKLGDVMYLNSGDKWVTVTKNTTLENVKIVIVDDNFVQDGAIANYQLSDFVEIIEVALELSSDKEEVYRQCTMKEIGIEEFTRYEGYKKVYLMTDKNDTVLRIYAMKEVGNAFNYGIIYRISIEYSGDVITERTVSVLGEDGMTRRYLATNIEYYNEGDLVAYVVKANTNKDLKDFVEILEVFHGGVIGNKRDFILKNYNNKVMTFSNSNLKIDLNGYSFILDDKEYYVDDYVFLNAQVKKDKKTGEYYFTNIERRTAGNLRTPPNSRVAINELTKTFVVYSGYQE